MRIPFQKIYQKIVRTILFSNIPQLIAIFFVLKYLFLFQIFFDFFFTLYSVYIAKYALELNPLVIAITPFWALILNLILWYTFRRITLLNWLILIVLNAFYLTANINHIFMLLDLFATGALSAFQGF